MVIEESVISIIIFSENYASSRWCLDELVHILKHREENDHIVLPIFYGIDPSHIRKQEGSYAVAFVEHEECYKDKMEKVQEWRQALTEAAGLSGWDSRNKSESEIVKEVLEHVRTKMDTIWSRSINSENLKGLVGIHRRLEKIESLLCDSNIVGICGMGGIGKMTLASALFKRIYNQFEGSYFAANVREESNKKGLADLANQVFSKLLNEKDIDVSKFEVNVRLGRKKLLLVLDDVDTFAQLQVLVGDRDRFGSGSKIIVTSRYLQVLKNIVDETYVAEALNSDEAQELFYLKAFKRNALRTEFTEISKSVFPFLYGLCSLTALNLDDCKIREIPDWLGSLTSLVTLSLRRNIFDGIPSSIGNLYKLNYLNISYCKNLRSLQELPLSIIYLNAVGCLSLEMVSTSRSTLTQGRWLDKYDTNIYPRNSSFLLQGMKAQVVVCYPRHEILKWFNIQCEGASTMIRLPPNWYNPKKFLGFVLSVVAASENGGKYSGLCQNTAKLLRFLICVQLLSIVIFEMLQIRKKCQ
ncbi:hypothetical protein UlMin_020132, partial [Ulmus minor]